MHDCEHPERPTPLDGVRVVEMADGAGEVCGRILADLGADVIRVEPPGGAASRRSEPLHEGVSLRHAVQNAGKRSVVVDPSGEDGRERLLGLLDRADVWIESARPGSLAALGLGAERVRARNPTLVVLSITDFGQTGPYRDWVATDWTLLAMGGVLSRSGLPGREPLVPPGEMALQVTAAQAAWAVLAAYWNRLESGHGDTIDFSLYEATVQVIDPAMGTVGTAQVAGYEETRDRPAPGPYPIFRCRDGHVRIVLLAPRQWYAMRAWLGEPQDLQDPELETIAGRARAAGRLHTAFEDHFRDRGKHELTLDGQARGVPIAPVLTTADVLAAEHFRARGAIARRELARGIVADAPTGFAEIDGRRVRAARRAPDARRARRRGVRRALPRAAPGGARRSRPPATPRGAARARLRRHRARGRGGAPVLRPGRRRDQDREPGVSRRRSRLTRALRDRPSRQPQRRREPAHPGGRRRDPPPGRAVRRGARQLQARHDGQAGPRHAGPPGDQPGDRRRAEQRGRRHRPVEHLDGLRPARALRGRADEPLALPRRRRRASATARRSTPTTSRPGSAPSARSPPSSAAGARGAARRSRRPRPRRSSCRPARCSSRKPCAPAR